MIPFDIKLCEEVELEMAKETEQNNAHFLAKSATQLMMQINGTLQENLDNWSHSRVSAYGLLLPKYSNIVQSFISIRNGKPSNNIIDMGIRNAKELFNEIDSDLSSEWSVANENKRDEIIKDILLPHMLFIRFLEKYKSEKLS